MLRHTGITARPLRCHCTRGHVRIAARQTSNRALAPAPPPESVLLAHRQLHTPASHVNSTLLWPRRRTLALAHQQYVTVTLWFKYILLPPRRAQQPLTKSSSGSAAGLTLAEALPACLASQLLSGPPCRAPAAPDTRDKGIDMKNVA
jgi:hypothetical protein